MFHPPQTQSASTTISTLSGRLSTATLLEDRRAAITGLRSLATDYPASVASESLRGLIGALSKGREDVDTIKITLETLLRLFSTSSPESSEEIVLWVADEFTQHKENFNILLDFLDSNDLYSRLYSLQLISAILGSRTERTEECIFMAPLGISRLVAVLDDKRDAIRNEGLSLLTYLTPNSAELQKRVAFEDAFDRIFRIIESEGSMMDGDRAVEDCLILLANLLRMNASNQSFFREAKCVPKVARLLANAVSEKGTEMDVAEWVKEQRNRNIYALLAVLRLFLVTGGYGTQINQVAFWQNGILNLVLQLAFGRATEMKIKAEALTTCADLIRGNPSLQEAFSQLQVTSVLDEIPVQANGTTQSIGIPQVYVIDGLLDLTLGIPLLAAFDSRLAACECIKAYFYNHTIIRKHFLHRAIEGHSSGSDETANVLTILLQPLEDHISGDPYRHWFAAVIVFQLIFESSNAKALAMSVAEGDASSGEEVVTCIQTLTENLMTGISKDADERVLVAYLMLLCGWLFEDPDGINDFLGEGSNLQGLIQAVSSTVGGSVVVQGLCAILLGIVYEFSTKDSPVPRVTIHSILASMGREKYIDRVSKLRSHPLVRDFEVLPQRLSSAQGSLPDVYFDRVFVDFLKDNFSRLLRAIDRDPGMEIPVIADGVQKGISRELVDSLRSQLEEKEKSLQRASDESLTLARQLGQEQADHRKNKEISAVEVARIKHINEGLQRNHEEELNKLHTEQNRLVQHHQKELENMRLEQTRAAQDLERQLEHVQKTAEANIDRVRKRMEAEKADLQKRVEKLEGDLAKANNDHIQDLQTAHAEYTSNSKDQASRLKRAEENAADFESRSDASAAKAEKAEALVIAKEKERVAVQGELDDLLMVFGDLEEQVEKYKEQLKSLGASVSDGEDDDEEDEDAEEESGVD